MWATKLLISPVKKRIFCPKTTKFGPKLAFLVNLGQAMQAYSVPCWWVVWWLWGAGCISQDTYLLYLIWEFRMNKSMKRCPQIAPLKAFRFDMKSYVQEVNASHSLSNFKAEGNRSHGNMTFPLHSVGGPSMYCIVQCMFSICDSAWHSVM